MTQHATFNEHRRTNDLPPIEELRSRFSYDPVTGIVLGRRGKPIRALNGDGYIVAHARSASGRRFPIMAHRLAFALQTGRWPFLVDHINRDKADNRWSNLRETDLCGNMLNRPVVGIRRMPFSRKWGIKAAKQLGYASTFCDAVKLRAYFLANAKSALPNEASQ